ncbi:hypothetical protein D3C76_94250 [compost metagenome]
MSPNTDNQFLAPVDIDALLQDSYLLVVELRQGAVASNSLALQELCAAQIEQAREQLKGAGLSQRSIDHISHAQCALLDETVLSFAKGETHATWVTEPMQARFFSRHQAGEFLYEDMREVLREPAPDLHVLTAFQRVLVLGFRGRYQKDSDPEREQLLAALNAQVAPLVPSHRIPTALGVDMRMSSQCWLQSPMAHALAVSMLLGSAWFGLDRLLAGVIATLQRGLV